MAEIELIRKMDANANQLALLLTESKNALDRERGGGTPITRERFLELRDGIRNAQETFLILHKEARQYIEK